jgi:hypothetical protein
MLEREGFPMELEGRRSGTIIWLDRFVLLAIAASLPWWSGDLERQLQIRQATEFRFEWSWFWQIQAVYAIAGIAFVLAVRFPFPRPRYAWGRLLIAAIAILPVVHTWFSLSIDWGPRFLRTFYILPNVPTPVWSILAGVAIGAGFGARRGAQERSGEATSSNEGVASTPLRRPTSQ